MQKQLPDDKHIRRDTFAALQDFVLPSFERVQSALANLTQATDQEAWIYSKTLPAYLIAGRDINLYRAGVAAGAFLSIDELDATFIDNAATGFADIAVHGFNPIELGPNLAVLQDMAQQHMQSIPKMTDDVAAQSTSDAIYATFSTNVWFGRDPDLLEFLARCLTPEESVWMLSLNSASERFYSDFDECFCCYPWSERLARAGTDEPSYTWLLNGALELLSEVGHVDAMRGNPYEASDQFGASIYEHLNHLPYKVLGVDGLLPLDNAVVDRRIVQALRQAWRTLAITLPPRTFREAMRAPLDHSSDRVKDLLERSGAFEWVTGVPWNQQGEDFEPPHSHH